MKQLDCRILLGVFLVWITPSVPDTASFDDLSFLVDTTMFHLQQRPDFGESGWQSVKELLQVEEEVTDCLINGMADAYFDYVLTTRDRLLDVAMPSVLDIREKMLDAATAFATEQADVIKKMRNFYSQHPTTLLNSKQKRAFLRYVAEMLGIYYYRVEEIQNKIQ